MHERDKVKECNTFWNFDQKTIQPPVDPEHCRSVGDVHTAMQPHCQFSASVTSWCPTEKTAPGWDSYASCQLDANQLRRQSLQCSWTSNLELPADGPQTAGRVIQPF